MCNVLLMFAFQNRAYSGMLPASSCAMWFMHWLLHLMVQPFLEDEQRAAAIAGVDRRGGSLLMHLTRLFVRRNTASFM
jgi:uncharacterized membrane protein YdjX (TVP38/TMEM64 family)